MDCSHCTSTSLQLLILVVGGSTAVTAHQFHCNSSFWWGEGFNCSHCTSTSLQHLIPVWGVQLQSLQRWTAVTAHQLHCNSSFWWRGVQLQSLHINFTATPHSGGGRDSTAVTAHQLHCNTSFQFGGFNCSHCKDGLQSLHINFTATPHSGGGGGFNCSHCTSTSLQLLIPVGGGSTAVTAKLDCSHCTSTSLHLLILVGGVWLQSLQSWTAVTAHQLHCNSSFQWGGFDCSHCKVGLQSLHINFTATPHSSGKGGSTAVTAKLDCSHCTSTLLQLLILVGGGFNCSHCTSTSLQLSFQWGGVWLQSLQSWTTVTAHQLHYNPSFWWGGGSTAVTADQLHCSPNSTPHFLGENWCPLKHSVHSTGWPLVIINNKIYYYYY